MTAMEVILGVGSLVILGLTAAHWFVDQRLSETKAARRVADRKLLIASLERLRARGRLSDEQVQWVLDLPGIGDVRGEPAEPPVSGENSL